MCTKETLSLTYKAIGQSVLNYGAPNWASTLSSTNMNHLQTQQNIAFRTITGCVKMSNINNLYNEDEILLVKAHTEMLAEKFLAGRYQSHLITASAVIRADLKTSSSTSFRPMRLTLNDTYRDRLKHLTNNKEQLNNQAYKNALKCIHRHTFYTQMNNDSKQLGTPPPKIAEQKKRCRESHMSDWHNWELDTVPC